MKRENVFLRIVIWVSMIGVFTLAAMFVWLLLCGGAQTTESLKWLQLMQTVGSFLLPSLLGAWIWSSNHRPLSWLQMDKGCDWRAMVLCVLIMVCALPGINLLAEWNSGMRLPESLGFIEDYMRNQESAAALLTERFLHADNVWILLINIGLMAVLPAVAEEITFRGTLQQLLVGKSEHRSSVRVHLAIWLTAFVFSAIHMQFYGFIPRMLMGALFGYVFVWTGSLWCPILMHFVNNGIAVVTYFIMQQQGQPVSITNNADTLGAGTTWWVGLVSIVVTIILITYLGQRGYVHRIHKR